MATVGTVPIQAPRRFNGKALLTSTAVYVVVIAVVIQDKQGGSARFHQTLHLANEVRANSDVAHGGSAGAAQHGAECRAGQRGSHHQARKEAHRRAGQDVDAFLARGV